MNPLSLPKKTVSPIDTCTTMLLQELPTQRPTNAVVLEVGGVEAIPFRNGWNSREKEKQP